MNTNISVREETQIIHRCMRDIAALSALPSIWAGYDTAAIVDSFADVLSKTLLLDAIYLNITIQGHNSLRMEAVRGGKGPYQSQLETFRNVYMPLTKLHTGGFSVLPGFHPYTREAIQLAVISFSSELVAGVLVVGSKSKDFPCETDRLLLNIATNHATLLLHSKSMEQALLNNQQRLRLALDSAQLGEWDLNVTENTIQRSLKHDQIYGYDQLQPHWNYQIFLNHVHPSDRDAIEQNCRQILATEDQFTLEYRVIWPDQSVHWIWSKGCVYRNIAGQAVRVTGVISDITERKQSDLHCRLAEQRITDFFENGSVALHWVDRNGIILRANQAELDLLGYTKEEYIGHPISEFHVDQDTINNILHRLARNETLHNYEARLRHKDGSIKYVLINSNVLWENGEFIHTRCFTRDVTERTIAEQALKEQNRILEILNRTGATLAAELDLQKLLQIVTDAGTELSGAEFGAFFYNAVNHDGESYILYTLSGVPREAFEKFPLPRNTALFGPTFRGEGVIRIADVLQDPRYGKSSPYHGMPKGHLPVRSYLAAPVISRLGEVIGGLFFGHATPGIFTERAERLIGGIAAQAAIAIDNARLYQATQTEISERKSIEQALRKAEERLRAALFASGTGTFRWNVGTNSLEWDDNLSRLFGLPDGHSAYNFEEFIACVHPEDREYVMGHIRSCVDQGTDLAMEFRIIWPDQTIHWLADKSKVFRDNDGLPLYMTGACVDITERKQAEEILRQSEEFKNRIIESSSDCIKVLDLNARLLFISEGGRRKLEIDDPDQVLDHSWIDFWQNEDRHAATAAVEAARRGEVGKFVGHCPTMTGTPKWWDVVITPISDASGKPEKLLAVSRDITEQRQVEHILRQAHDELELRVQERTTALQEANNKLQEFNYTVSHDLRAPIRAINGYSKLLEEDCGNQLEPVAHDYLRRIQAAAAKMDDLIQGLLSYSRTSIHDFTMEEINLQELIDELLNKQQSLIEEQQVELNILKPLPVVRGHYLMLYQAIENLLLNAIKFVALGVIPQVRIWSQQDNNVVRFYIKDNGIGIAPEHHPRVFNIFERLHGRVYDGTGIGLTIVRKSVERMGGQIGLESEVGKGSTFWIELPNT